MVSTDHSTRERPRQRATALHRPCRRRVVVRALVICLALASGTAGAETDFVWQAPDACPDAGDVRLRIEHRLGMPVDGSVHGIEVAIDRTGSGFVAHIDARSVTVANEVRTLTSSRCDELADAVAVVVARLASEARQREELRAPHLHAIAMRRAAPERIAAWGTGLHVMGVSGVGIVPSVGVGGEAAAYVRRHDAFVEVGVSRWAPSSSYLADGAPGRVDVGLTSYALRGGWSPADKPLRAWLGAEVGSMRGRGVALVDNEDGTAPWTTLNAGFGVAWPMTPHARVVGSFELGVPLERVRFVLAQGGEIYRPSPAVARCALGLELGWR